MYLKMKTSDKRSIGVFDSGLGGLTVVRQIIKYLPNEDIVYLGDTARIPYGTRSREVVTKFSLEDANFLLQKNVKCIIIACNTASAYAGDFLKKKFKLPIFDVIGPAISEARKISTKGKIGVIATRGTVASGAYRVPYSVACPLLVPFIEEGELKGHALKFVIKKYLKGFTGTNIDTLILGCTHYPIIGGLIQKEIGKNVKLVNPEIEVAHLTKNYLMEHGMLTDSKKEGRRSFYVTDMTPRFAEVAEMFLGSSIKPNLKKVTL